MRSKIRFFLRVLRSHSIVCGPPKSHEIVDKEGRESGISLSSAEMLQEFHFNQGWFPWLIRRFVDPYNFPNMHNGPGREQRCKWQESFVFPPSLSEDQLFCKVPSWFWAGGSSSSLFFFLFYFFEWLLEVGQLITAQMLAVRKKQRIPQSRTDFLQDSTLQKKQLMCFPFE